MNSFFASAEQHLRPELRGCPVAVVPVESEGTCAIAASVEAKAFGVRVGTRVPELRRLCPGIQIVRARPEEYVALHHSVARSIERCAPVHKAYSIDEWGVRLLGAQREPEAALELGQQMKAEIARDHSRCLSCSVGLAPTRLLAKIAAELKKPDGLTLLRTRDLPDRLDHLVPTDLCGIASGLAGRLERSGVRTVRDLWELSEDQAVAAWGSVVGRDWWAAFHGIDEPEQVTKRSSMSHANVLEPSLRTEEGARAMITRLVCRLGARLRDEDYLASMLSISVKYADGQRFSARLDLPQIGDTPTLVASAHTLWESRTTTSAAPLKVGVVVSGLVSSSQVSGELFGSSEQPLRLSKAMDEITGRWGLRSLFVGSMHGCLQHMDDKIAFGRIPAGRGPN